MIHDTLPIIMVHLMKNYRQVTIYSKDKLVIHINREIIKSVGKFQTFDLVETFGKRDTKVDSIIGESSKIYNQMLF